MIVNVSFPNSVEFPCANVDAALYANVAVWYVEPFPDVPLTLTIRSAAAIPLTRLIIPADEPKFGEVA